MKNETPRAEIIKKYTNSDGEINWNDISKLQILSEEFIKEFQDKVNWNHISRFQKLSEKFIKEFQDKVDWEQISYCQKLSEEFIREFKDKVDWNFISMYQYLSEEFIKEFQDKVNWRYVSICQELSEEFIEEFKDKVNWEQISYCQKLSEKFMREFKDKINWNDISHYQILSEEFIEKFKDKINVDDQLKSHHDLRTLEEMRSEMKDYAFQHNLEFKDDILIAYRKHDNFDRGLFNKTFSYEKGNYYRDWHCDLNPENEDSFGFGIWPEENTKVEVKLEDWGCAVKEDEDGKARVWGFRVI